MSTSNLPRREWLKKMAFSVGAVAVAPTALWATTVEQAQRNNQKFLYKNSAFDEFTPPKFPFHIDREDHEVCRRWHIVKSSRL